MDASSGQEREQHQRVQEGHQAAPDAGSKVTETGGNPGLPTTLRVGTDEVTMTDYTDYTKWYQAVDHAYDGCEFERDRSGNTTVWFEDQGTVAFWEADSNLGWIE